MDELFDRYAGPEEVIRLKSLEIDLGRIQWKKFDDEFVNRALEQLELQLIQLIRQDREQLLAIPVRRNRFEQWLVFLQKGALDWRVSREMEADFHKLVLDSMGMESAAVQQLRGLIQSNPKAFDRLIFQHPDPFLKILTELYTGRKQDALSQVLSEIKEMVNRIDLLPVQWLGLVGSRRGESLRLHFWKQILGIVILERQKQDWHELVIMFLKSLVRERDWPLLVRRIRTEMSLHRQGWPFIEKALDLDPTSASLPHELRMGEQQPGKDSKRTLEKGSRSQERGVSKEGRASQEGLPEWKPGLEQREPTNEPKADEQQPEKDKQGTREKESKFIEESEPQEGLPEVKPPLEEKGPTGAPESPREEAGAGKDKVESGSKVESLDQAKSEKHPAKANKEAAPAIEAVRPDEEDGAEVPENTVPADELVVPEAQGPEGSLEESRERASRQAPEKDDDEKDSSDQPAKQITDPVPSSSVPADQQSIRDDTASSDRMDLEETPPKQRPLEDGKTSGSEEPVSGEQEGLSAESPSHQDDPHPKETDQASKMDRSGSMRKAKKAVADHLEPGNKGEAKDREIAAGPKESREVKRDVIPPVPRKERKTVPEGTEEPGALQEDLKERETKADQLAASDRSPEQASTGPRYRTSEDLPVGTSFYVYNAGVVLIHPFLSHFFKALQLVKGDEFVDQSAQHKAIHLIQYLATREVGLPEYELLLPKFLCGLPFDIPIEREVQITEQEMKEGEGLLEAAIKHWGALGEVSPDALREGFFQREGKLEKREAGWYLTVEQRTIDILLGRLPWNLSLLKLPWTPELLRVEWA